MKGTDMNGRIFVGKDGRRTEHFLKEGVDHTPDEVARAKKYPRGAGKAFQALAPEELEARRVKPRPTAPKPAAAMPPSKKDA
jgi:hypothetical protein